jgi:hypothetical protein
LCISLLNSLLKFEDNEQIDWIEYDTNELIPQIPALKDAIVDVRCKDKNRTSVYTCSAGIFS